MNAINPTAMKPAALTDAEVIALVNAGQIHFFSVLVKRHTPLVEYLLRRYCQDPVQREEAVQDTFLRAFRHLASFRGEAKFVTWLGRIAVSVALTQLRRKAPVTFVELEEARLHQLEAAETPSLEGAERRRILLAALQGLPPEDALALKLFYLGDQSIREISQQTGWTETNTKSRLSRARKRLRQQLVAQRPAEEWGWD